MELISVEKYITLNEINEKLEDGIEFNFSGGVYEDTLFYEHANTRSDREYIDYAKRILKEIKVQ